MDQINDIEEKIWMLLDGALDSKEESFVNGLIQSNKDWRTTYEQLLVVHNDLKSIELEQPSMRFTKNVMEEIARLQVSKVAKEYLNRKIIWGIGGFFLLMIIGMLVYFFGQINWATASDAKAPFGIDLTKVDFSLPFNNSVTTIFMMFNIVLALVFFDQYLGMKKKAWKTDQQ